MIAFDTAVNSLTLIAETATAGIGKLRTNTVDVRVLVESEQPFSVKLTERAADVQRVAAGKFVAAHSVTRIDGDTMIISIVEERPIVMARLFLREEIRVRTRSAARKQSHTATLRAEQARVDRDDPIQQGTPTCKTTRLAWTQPPRKACR